MPFCSLVSRRRPSDCYQRSDLMDLSSLEGPPINDPRVVITPSSMDGRVRLEPPTPDDNRHPSRLWKPLPPRPSSAEPMPLFSTYHPLESDASHDQPINHRHRPSNSRSDTSLSEGQLRRARAQRGRRTPSPEIDMDINLHMELQVDPRAPIFNESGRSRSPPRIPTASLDTNIQPSNSQGQRSRRTRSCCPLVWVESEQQWVVLEGHNSSQQHEFRTEYIRPLPSFDGPSFPEPYLGFDLGASGSVDHPPTYESHGFSPTYARRMGQGRWSEVAYRVHDLSTSNSR